MIFTGRKAQDEDFLFILLFILLFAFILWLNINEIIRCDTPCDANESCVDSINEHDCFGELSCRLILENGTYRDYQYCHETFLIEE